MGFAHPVIPSAPVNGLVQKTTVQETEAALEVMKQDSGPKTLRTICRSRSPRTDEVADETNKKVPIYGKEA